jgi:biotin-(acetyl-CoA carboxylase) ligase
LNVSTLGFPEELPNATSLLRAGAQPESLGLEGLLVDLLAALERRTRVFLPKGLGPLLRELDEHDYLRGRQVRVDDCAGTAQGFDEDGRLLLSTPSGARAVQVGHVELLDAHSGENTSG